MYKPTSLSLQKGSTMTLTVKMNSWSGTQTAGIKGERGSLSIPKILLLVARVDYEGGIIYEIDAKLGLTATDASGSKLTLAIRGDCEEYGRCYYIRKRRTRSVTTVTDSKANNQYQYDAKAIMNCCHRPGTKQDRNLFTTPTVII